MQLYEDGLCSGCGQPASRAHNPDMEGYYTPVTVTCQACAARDREAADHQGAGVLVGVTDESYTEGYEPRLVVSAHQSSTPHDESDHGERSS